MNKNELMELAKKVGVKSENFEFGYKEDPETTEKQITEAAKFLGYIK